MGNAGFESSAIVDAALAVGLLVGIPLTAIWRELAGFRRPIAARYRATTLLVAAFVGVLAAQWIALGRDAALLGLNLPPTKLGLICLGVAAAALAVFALALRRGPASQDDDDPVPPSAECRQFVVFAFAAGIGWEILYRGFLLWFLPPLIGPTASIGVAAVAYGLAHGIKNARAVAASCLSATLFTIGYATTHDLWWLMLIHVGLPLLVYVVPTTSGNPVRQ